MPDMTRQQLEEKLQQKEHELNVQLDRLYTLAKQQAAMDVLKGEFKRVVERVTEKYFLLFSLLETDKATYSETEYEERAQALRDTYKEDLALLAVAIDEARGISPT